MLHQSSLNGVNILDSRIGSLCSWPGYTSKIKFKTLPLFRQHLTNIHINPRLCTEPGCEWKTPFGRTSDLARQKMTVHSKERAYFCAITSCDAQIKEFACKDHLIKHMRDLHANYYCPLNHCRRGRGAAFTTPEEEAAHIEGFHDGDIFECAVKACAQAPSSRFSYGFLKTYLRIDHGLTYRSVNRVMGKFS